MSEATRTRTHAPEVRQRAVEVLQEGVGHRALAAVKDRLENGLTVREAMIKHKIPSESSVKAWCRQYRDGGEAALVDKPRGRKPRVKRAE
ncbi:Uncharacterised protein [Collinsella aerofaciens]|uniref:Insertion element IS150 protein InsJ-like helix-turn-helix domain-containing protein n=1 Tax=Collinsella aerofaciens TaxID=74426 RepID=A0A6N3C323_9ACTN